MNKQLFKFMLLCISFALLISPVQTAARGDKRIQTPCVSQSAVKLQNDFRKLWIDHTIWTRAYITSALAGLEDQEKVLARLLRNQEDIGNAIKPYYGGAAGNKLTTLLKEHILIAGKLVDAAKSGNEANVKTYNTDWYRNADEIAEFLSNANPNWPKNELKELLHMHLKLVADDVTARIQKNWDASILAFDKGEEHIIKLADALTAGIIKQFPNRF